MNGVHDLGGTDGLGRVEVPDREPVFAAEWLFRCEPPSRPDHAM
jgi:hypothetical protein